jgi:hypothetical protein
MYIFLFACCVNNHQSIRLLSFIFSFLLRSFTSLLGIFDVVLGRSMPNRAKPSAIRRTTSTAAAFFRFGDRNFQFHIVNFLFFFAKPTKVKGKKFCIERSLAAAPFDSIHAQLGRLLCSY